MRDTILTDDSGARYSFGNIKTQGWLNGHASGLDAAVDWLKERAVTLFRDGKDDAAMQLRKLAEELRKELRPLMEARAKRHESEHPAVVEPE